MTTITVCTTCRTPARRDADDPTRDGEAFLPLVEAEATKHGVTVRGVACLMGCEHGCNVAVSGADKMTYVLGRFEGTAEDAEALVEYAAAHAENEGGVVPFRSWPQGVKGHFVALSLIHI